ncbi:MAG: outer membrane lipoprotein carrier protein LolA [Sphingopyxis sp.]|nr:outer membrane lipoprotein carrier protein LolA [Sphingopyxis sp.]
MNLKLPLIRLGAWTLAPVAVAGLVLGGPVAAQSSDTLATVQSHLKSTSSMTANFVQTDRKGQRVSGELTLKRPGKIRFQYEKGVPLLIVGDGSSLTMVDYEVKQVQRWPVKNSPLGALLDPERDLSKYARVLPTGNDGVLSVEVKDPKRPEYGTITMVFVRDGAAPAGLRLRGWVALDSQNNRTRIDLSNQKFNVAVADSAFKWTDPRPKRRGRVG